MWSGAGPDNYARWSGRTNVPLDEFLARPHFLKQYGIPDDSRGILHFPAGLVEACNDTYDGAFHDVGQVGDAVEAHAPRPLVDHFDHAEAGLADKIVGVVCREDDLMERLDLVYLFGDLDDGCHASSERGGERGLDVSLLLEDESGEQSDDLFGCVVCKDVLEDEFG